MSIFSVILVIVLISSPFVLAIWLDRIREKKREGVIGARVRSKKAKRHEV